MADRVTIENIEYWVAPEEDREGNRYYIGHVTDSTPTPSEDCDRIQVETGIIYDENGDVVLDSHPEVVYPQNNPDPSLNWESGSGRCLYFSPSETKSVYKVSDFSVLGIPTYTYDTCNNNMYVCSGYQNDTISANQCMTRYRGISNPTAITGCTYNYIDDYAKDLQEKKIDKNWQAQYNTSENNWDLNYVTPTQFDPRVIDEYKRDRLPQSSYPPPTSQWYFGIVTKNTNQVFSGKITSSVPIGDNTTTTYPNDFSPSTTLYWKTDQWSLTS